MANSPHDRSSSQVTTPEMLEPNSSLARSYLIMQKRGVRSLPVGQDLEVVGVITQEAVELAFQESLNGAPSGLKVIDYMLSPVGRADCETRLSEAKELMASGNIQVFEVTRDSRAIGYLTKDDLVAFLFDMPANFSQKLADIIDQLAKTRQETIQLQV